MRLCKAPWGPWMKGSLHIQSNIMFICSIQSREENALLSVAWNLPAMMFMTVQKTNSLCPWETCCHWLWFPWGEGDGSSAGPVLALSILPRDEKWGLQASPYHVSSSSQGLQARLEVQGKIKETNCDSTQRSHCLLSKGTSGWHFLLGVSWLLAFGR